MTPKYETLIWYMETMKLSLTIAIVVSAFFCGFLAQANSSSIQDSTDYAEQLDSVLVSQKALPSLLDAKLTIDQLIDSDHDSAITRSEINSMVVDLRALITDEMSDWDKAKVLKTYLYQAGPWNDNRPFAYDHDDPLGQSKSSRLIHNYLRTRLGNCVSMPVLHAILGQEIGLDMTLSTAPLHIFVKFTPFGKDTVNLEATSGGYPARDAWYEQNLPMRPKAIEAGMFMAKLTPEQNVSVLGHDLASHLIAEGEYQAAILLSERLLKEFETYGPLYLTRGSAMYGKIQRDFQTPYPNADDVPEDLRPQLQYLLQQNMVSFQIAESLGWADPDELAKEREGDN